jgi:hypothetical protein
MQLGGDAGAIGFGGSGSVAFSQFGNFFIAGAATPDFRPATRG